MSMKIAIRMDDITPDMNWENFLRFKRLCDQHQIKPLIGVVPDNQDENLHFEPASQNKAVSATGKATPFYLTEEENQPSNIPQDFWAYLRKLQQEGWQIAQHGYIHRYHTQKMGCFPLNKLSEFAGIPYQQQYEALKAGKELLQSHGIHTDIFMAPAHSYDKNTLRALKKLGFAKLTDGFGKMPYQWRGFTFYPISYRQSSSLKKASGYTTFVVHANGMNPGDFEYYERLFQTYADRLISFTEYMTVPPKKRGAARRIAEYLAALSKFILVQYCIMHSKHNNIRQEQK
ncbi:MAG: DUF2334 domain-containing protein [Lachnospiraceae bacterium]|nr:DUF2334 domain-containing protein [Lachnospiraceae bacterium]